MASRFASSFGTLLDRSASVVWFVLVLVNRKLRSSIALTRPFLVHRHVQAPMYYRGANAALLLYDITNQASFQDVRGWLNGEP